MISLMNIHDTKSGRQEVHTIQTNKKIYERRIKKEYNCDNVAFIAH
jgi:hypothetical protein